MPESADNELLQVPEDVKDDSVYIYRGINKAHEGERAGKWWSTNPYYALVRVGNGTLFVATVEKSELEQHAKDASLEVEYKNYLFPDQDPSTAREATKEEIEALRQRATYSQGPVGGVLMKPPEDPIRAGREVFSTQKVTQ